MTRKVAKPKVDHYAALGVDPDADGPTIKRAYRRKSRLSHPDKGGTAAAQAELNEAWRVLGDPERRALYDLTGESDRKSADERMLAYLMEAFMSAIRSENADPLSAAIAFLRDRSAQHRQQRTQATAARAKMIERRGWITRGDDGINCYTRLIDAEIKAIDAVVEQCDENLRTLDLAREELKAYKSAGVSAVTVDGLAQLLGERSRGGWGLPDFSDGGAMWK